MRLSTTISFLLLLVLAAPPASADLAALLGELAPEGEPAGVAPLLWSIAADDDFAVAFLDAVDERQLVLADTLISILRLPEPQARPLFPDMYVISDFGPPPGERDPAWADLRWAGVRWMRRIADYGSEGRDLRLREELDAAMADVGRPQRAEMGGLVLVLLEWWADRGLDPGLTHYETPRDPAAKEFARAVPPASVERPRPGLELLLAMDRDPVVRERVLNRLAPDETAWLVRDLMIVVELGVDSLHALGVEPRQWDAEAGVARGHSVPGLRRLALEALDATAPAVVSGPDDLTRRLARIDWWDAARFEARYWSDPREAPEFSIFLLGLRRPASEGGRELMQWVRLIHLQKPELQERILEQLGELQQPVVAELLGLAALDRVSAAKAGFRMVYTRRPLVPAEGSRPVAVAIDWAQVQSLLRRMLAAITMREPPPVLRAAPESLAAWWADWWAAERENPLWYRGPLDPVLELPPSAPGLDLQPGRGRVD